MPFGCTINLRSNNEPSRSQASLARGKACQSRQASQRMSAGPGSKIRALSTPEFSLFRGLCRARPRCGAVCARPAGVAALWQCISRGRSRGAVHGILRCAVSRRAEPVGCLPRPIVGAVFSAVVRGISCVLFAAHGDCTVFSCCLLSLHGVSCRSPSLCRAFLPFKESAVCVVINSVHGRWTIDATCL